jgi:hypothetical protein
MLFFAKKIRLKNHAKVQQIVGMEKIFLAGQKLSNPKKNATFAPVLITR